MRQIETLERVADPVVRPGVRLQLVDRRATATARRQYGGEREQRRAFRQALRMRIIAGERKGHTIFAPRGLDTRPTGDRVREAAFNLIGPVDGTSVLDLFAGSGAMGLEALSRGAERAVFVESDAEAARAIERNLDRLRLSGATVLRRDALTALAGDAAAGRVY